jgi:hypothetical protein
VDGELVGGHHDGSVGDLPDQLSDEAPVKAAATFGAIDRHEARPEAAVTRSFLAKTCASDFCNESTKQISFFLTFFCYKHGLML